MWSSALTTELHYKRGGLPAAVLLRVGAHFTRNMRVSQSKHAHLHKNAVVHTLAALWSWLWRRQTGAQPRPHRGSPPTEDVVQKGEAEEEARPETARGEIGSAAGPRGGGGRSIGRCTARRKSSRLNWIIRQRWRF